VIIHDELFFSIFSFWLQFWPFKQLLIGQGDIQLFFVFSSFSFLVFLCTFGFGFGVLAFGSMRNQ